MKCVKMLSFITLVMVCISGYALTEEVLSAEAQTLCPVMGGKINKDVYADYEGKRVYFCCEGCVPEFQKDPAKYINKLENEGVKLQEVPTAEVENKSKITTGSKCKQRGFCDGCPGCDSCGDWGCL